MFYGVAYKTRLGDRQFKLSIVYFNFLNYWTELKWISFRQLNWNFERLPQECNLVRFKAILLEIYNFMQKVLCCKVYFILFLIIANFNDAQTS